MVVTHPLRRQAGMRRLLIHFELWRQLRQAKRLMARSAAAREAGENDRAGHYVVAARKILAAARRALEMQEAGS